MPVGGMDVTGVPVGGMDVTGVPGGCDHMLGFGLFLPLTILTTGSFFFGTLTMNQICIFPPHPALLIIISHRPIPS